MASCEKCWSDAGIDARLLGGEKAERYGELIEKRKANPCTPEEQAGPDAEVCPQCDRRTIHQWTGECMACGTVAVLARHREMAAP